MKILCIGDSLGMPRPNVSYKDTWFYKVSQEYKDISFIDKFRRQMTTEALEDRDFYISHYFPDAVIVQLGVCDCSPRIINERNLFWKVFLTLSKKLKMETVFWKVVKSLFSRNKSERVWVPIDKFTNNIGQFIEKMERENSNVKFLFIGIGTPSLSLQERSPFMMDNIIKYNKVLSTLAERMGEGKVCYVNPLNAADESLYVDGYHPNSLGHERVYKEVSTIIKQWIIAQ